jgi:hypothetical protein
MYYNVGSGWKAGRESQRIWKSFGKAGASKWTKASMTEIEIEQNCAGRFNKIYRSSAKGRNLWA